MKSDGRTWEMPFLTHNCYYYEVVNWSSHQWNVVRMFSLARGQNHLCGDVYDHFHGALWVFGASSRKDAYLQRCKEQWSEAVKIVQHWIRSNLNWRHRSLSSFQSMTRETYKIACHITSNERKSNTKKSRKSKNFFTTYFWEFFSLFFQYKSVLLVKSLLKWCKMFFFCSSFRARASNMHKIDSRRREESALAFPCALELVKHGLTKRYICI